MSTLWARVGRRVGLAASALAAVVLASWVLSGAAPGRFGDELRLDPGVAPETVAAQERRTATGPAAASLGRWLAGLARGDLGASTATGAPVTPLILDRVASTLALTVPATLAAWTMALGLCLGLRRSRGGVRGGRDVAIATIQSLPDAVVALVLVRLALVSGWFPVGGQGDTQGRPGLSAWLELGHHAALPISGLALTMLPMLVRQIDAALATTESAPLLQGARARGLTPRAVIWRHQARVAVPAVMPLLGVSVGALLGSGLMFEVAFAWPGLGTLLVDAVFARDLPVVLGAVGAAATVLVAANAAGDAMAWLSDPRLRE